MKWHDWGLLWVVRMIFILAAIMVIFEGGDTIYHWIK